MAAHSHHRVVRRKSFLRLADAKKLARLDPDMLARRLLSWRSNAKNNQQRREIWHWLQHLGGTAAVKRAISTLSRTRSPEEAEAVAHAAAVDQWFEIGPALHRRFHREIVNLGQHTANQTWELFRALGFAAIRLGERVDAGDLRVLLGRSSARLRAVGAEICAQQNRADLLDDILPLCWERGEASGFAGDLAGRLGSANHAAVLWSKTLRARKRRRRDVVRQLLHTLAQMGAFDIQVALRTWIEEDFADPGTCAWHYGLVWARLVQAKLAAGMCQTEEALTDLRWFIKMAGPGATCGFGGYGAEQGPFHVAQLLARLGVPLEAEALLARFAACGVPAPEQFPELLFEGLRNTWPKEAGMSRIAWLAALGDAGAQAAVVQHWQEALREGRWPDHWGARRFLNPEVVRDVLRDALRSHEPDVLRHALTLLMHDPALAGLKPEIAELAATHPCAVVRWKARRVLADAHARQNAAQAETPQDTRWVRLDAAVLAGALSPSRTPAAEVPKSSAPRGGVHPPKRAGEGFCLELEGLTSAQRRTTLDVILRAPLSHAIHRPLPLGPAMEERPDVRAVRELAPPSNEIDARMAELAGTVMSFWSDDDDNLTLDEEGIALIATGLCADARALDEDDVLACGAFIGEAIRKRVGGQWTGFDDHYLLEVKGELLDPAGWAAEISAKHDANEGVRYLLQRFSEAAQKFAVTPWHYHPDPGAAFEQAILRLCAMPLDTPMTELLAEARVMSYRLVNVEWPLVFSAVDDLIKPGYPAGVRAAAALSLYAPGDAFGRAWGRWGRARRERSGLCAALAEAMEAAAERDDLEAMPNWTLAPSQGRFSFLNPLRKLMDKGVWRRVLLLLLRQRAAAADRAGVAWCLYSYRYEFPDGLDLIRAFCEMSVSARETALRATFHCTREERRLFRAFWAESLRDPSPVVVQAALSAIHTQRATSLRPLVQALSKDERPGIPEMAAELLRVWDL